MTGSPGRGFHEPYTVAICYGREHIHGGHLARVPLVARMVKLILIGRSAGPLKDPSNTVSHFALPTVGLSFVNSRSRTLRPLTHGPWVDGQSLPGRAAPADAAKANPVGCLAQPCSEDG